MLDQLLRFIQNEELFTKEDHILVGYSGGADSTCLLHALVSLGFDVAAAHLHHGQRPEADEELETCAAFAESLEIPFVSGRADVPMLARSMKIGLEEAGREARYNFFERAARQLECPFIATAHTQTDQTETILFNLIRGTGLGGLRGIPSKRQAIVRPLLRVNRAETLEYCRIHGLGFLTDPGNENLDFSRARIRINVIPELEKINPNLAETVFRTAQIIGEEDDFLDGMAAAALEQSELVPNRELAFLTKHLEFQVDRDVIGSLPPVLFKRAVRLGVRSLGGHFEAKHLYMFAEAIRTQDNGSLTTPEETVSVSWNERRVAFTRDEKVSPFRNQLEMGILESPEMGWKLSARLQPSSGKANVRKSLAAELPGQSVRRPLYVRNVKSGDRMRPWGFDSSRKVSDLLSEAKVTRLARERLPLVCDMVGPIWLPGVCLDARMEADRTQTNVISLTFEPL